MFDAKKLFNDSVSQLRDKHGRVIPAEVVLLWHNDSVLGVYDSMDKAEAEVKGFIQAKGGTWNTLEYGERRRRWYSDKVARLECETRKVG